MLTSDNSVDLGDDFGVIHRIPLDACQVPYPYMPSYPQYNYARSELECLRSEVQFLRELVKSLLAKSETDK